MKASEGGGFRNPSNAVSGSSMSPEEAVITVLQPGKSPHLPSHFLLQTPSSQHSQTPACHPVQITDLSRTPQNTHSHPAYTVPWLCSTHRAASGCLSFRNLPLWVCWTSAAIPSRTSLGTCSAAPSCPLQGSFHHMAGILPGPGQLGGRGQSRPQPSRSESFQSQAAPTSVSSYSADSSGRLHRCTRSVLHTENTASSLSCPASALPRSRCKVWQAAWEKGTSAGGSRGRFQGRDVVGTKVGRSRSV